MREKCDYCGSSKVSGGTFACVVWLVCVPKSRPAPRSAAKTGLTNRWIEPRNWLLTSRTDRKRCKRFRTPFGRMTTHTHAFSLSLHVCACVPVCGMHSRGRRMLEDLHLRTACTRSRYNNPITSVSLIRYFSEIGATFAKSSVQPAKWISAGERTRSLRCTHTLRRKNSWLDKTDGRPKNIQYSICWINYELARAIVCRVDIVTDQVAIIDTTRHSNYIIRNSIDSTFAWTDFVRTNKGSLNWKCRVEKRYA